MQEELEGLARNNGTQSALEDTSKQGARVTNKHPLGCRCSRPTLGELDVGLRGGVVGQGKADSLSSYSQMGALTACEADLLEALQGVQLGEGSHDTEGAWVRVFLPLIHSAPIDGR